MKWRWTSSFTDLDSTQQNAPEKERKTERRISVADSLPNDKETDQSKGSNISRQVSDGLEGYIHIDECTGLRDDKTTRFTRKTVDRMACDSL